MYVEEYIMWSILIDVLSNVWLEIMTSYPAFYTVIDFSGIFVEGEVSIIFSLKIGHGVF